MIYAVSPEGVIGVGGVIPWRHAGDLKRFKRTTMGSTIVMGRNTFDSIGNALPGRRNIVVTSRALEVPGIERAGSIEEALGRVSEGDVWFIGGARIYEGAMSYVDVIDVTYVPDRVEALNAVRAPRIDETVFRPGPLRPHEDEPALSRRVYERRPA
ncbi:MAG: dihydrofolate reductase [Myxococcota bacterium]|nr:dihydrofolate reductase [Myxococcota bacterium]